MNDYRGTCVMLFVLPPTTSEPSVLPEELKWDGVTSVHLFSHIGLELESD